MKTRDGAALGALLALILAVSVTSVPANEPIRVGFLAPLTGIFAQAGRDMLDGLKLGLEHSNYSGGERPVETSEE